MCFLTMALTPVYATPATPGSKRHVRTSASVWWRSPWPPLNFKRHKWGFAFLAFDHLAFSNHFTFVARQESTGN